MTIERAAYILALHILQSTMWAEADSEVREAVAVAIGDSPREKNRKNRIFGE
jgi:hypothetical protein